MRLLLSRFLAHAAAPEGPLWRGVARGAGVGQPASYNRPARPKSGWLLVLALSLLSGCAAAQQPLTLSAALERAKRDYPSLRAAQAEVDAARARGWMLQVPYRPMVGLNAFGSKGRGEMIFGSTVEPLSLTHMNADEQATLNGMLMWRVFSFGRERVAKDIASLETTASSSMLKIEGAELAMRVRLAFSAALLKEATVAARRAALDSSNEVLKLTQARYEAGKVPEAFVYRAQADASAMARELAMARADAASSLAGLRGAAGLGQADPASLGAWDASLTAPASLDAALKDAQTRRAELEGLDRTGRAFSLRADLYRRSALPELSFTAMGDAMAMSGAKSDTSYRLGLILSFPLLDGGERRAGMAEQKAMADKAKADLDVEKLKIDAEVASAWAMWLAAPSVRQAADAELKASREAYRIALLRYQEGKAILTEVTDARAQLAKAQVAQAESDDYTRRSWTMLRRAIGDGLDGMP